jgi:hypothetical protein
VLCQVCSISSKNCHILYCTVYCTVQYTVLYSVLYCTVYCTVHCTVHCTVYCTVYCTVHVLQPILSLSFFNHFRNINKRLPSKLCKTLRSIRSPSIITKAFNNGLLTSLVITHDLPTRKKVQSSNQWRNSSS